jgi:hypothetical protein
MFAVVIMTVQMSCGMLNTWSTPKITEPRVASNNAAEMMASNPQ